MKIFISHSNSDKARVREILTYLPKQIVSWIDEDELSIGMDVQNFIRSEIRGEADFVVIFLGQETLNSPWVQKELQWALEREEELNRVFVLPVLLADVWDKVQPIEFQSRRYLSCFSQDKDSVKNLANQLGAHLSSWINKISTVSATGILLARTVFSEEIFLREINLREVSKLYLFAHTGRRSFANLYNRIDDFEAEQKTTISNANPQLEIQVLIRTPYAETQDRYGQIFETIRKIQNLKKTKGLNIDVRFYAGLPTFRCVICEYKDSLKRRACISTYKWQPRFKSHAFDHFFNIRGASDSEDPLLQMAMSWFNHYWGNDEVHTLVFDFDDTIMRTMDIQVEAWCKTIESLIKSEERKKYLRPDVANALNNADSLRSLIRTIFLSQQLAPKIFEAIFPEFPDAEQRLKDEINKRRFKEREELTLKGASLFKNVANTLSKLSDKYQLAIISSTSERLIEQVLVDHKINKYFSIILGKHGPKFTWEQVYDKATLLLKLSTLTGIPLERTVFIGDNNSDFQSAKQLNTNFIEARMIAHEAKGLVPQNTLIDYKSDDVIRYFHSYEEPTLEEYIKEINEALSRQKYKLDPHFLA